MHAHPPQPVYWCLRIDGLPRHVQVDQVWHLLRPYAALLRISLNYHHAHYGVHVKVWVKDGHVARNTARLLHGKIVASRQLHVTASPTSEAPILSTDAGPSPAWFNEVDGPRASVGGGLQGPPGRNLRYDARSGRFAPLLPGAQGRPLYRPWHVLTPQRGPLPGHPSPNPTALPPDRAEYLKALKAIETKMAAARSETSTGVSPKSTGSPLEQDPLDCAMNLAGYPPLQPMRPPLLPSTGQFKPKDKAVREQELLMELFPGESPHTTGARIEEKEKSHHCLSQADVSSVGPQSSSSASRAQLQALYEASRRRRDSQDSEQVPSQRQ